MFGRLSQLAQNVQQSFNADDSGNAAQGSPSRKQDGETIENLQAQLDEAEERNKSINAAFKKLLKEKEEEIKSLKKGLGSSESQSNENKIEESKVDEESFYLLKRKTEEYQMLIEQKDESINMLMQNLKETEDLKDKIEEQERKNTEKLMFELAERINAHETIQRKMEELKQVMNEKDNAVHNMADQMAAQEELLKAREEAIKKLKRMATGGEASEEMIVTLQKAVHSKDNQINEMSQTIDKLEMEKKLLDAKVNNRDGLESSKDHTIETLWAEIKQKNDMIQKFAAEKENQAQEVQRKEEELKEKLDVICEKESTVNELSLKLRSMERELNLSKSDNQFSSDENTREMTNLKNQIGELKEILKSKTQTIDMFQKEIEDRDAITVDLMGKLKDLQLKLSEIETKSEQLKVKYEQESKEKEAYKQKCENEAEEKNELKKQLDEVGRHLSSELDSKIEEVKDLKDRLTKADEGYAEAVAEGKRLSEKLNQCQDLGVEKSMETENVKRRVEELEDERKLIDNNLHEKSKELEMIKNDLMEKEREIENQKEKFSNELERVQHENENEKGLTLSQLANIEKELAVAKEEMQKLEDENNELKSNLTDVSKQKEDFEKDLKVLESRNADLGNTVEDGKALAGELELSRRENLDLKKKLEESLALQEASEKQHKLLKEECLMLNENAKEMETAMNHMVDKLNNAELKMNESIQEHNELNEKLKGVTENNKTLLTQKTEIEAALEEFVKCTESRKRRSGRTSNDEQDAARLTPTEGQSGYNTPVSKEGSPRNTSYMETYQPLNANLVGNALEGKAIGDIFKLVEEERSMLEAKLSSVSKEKDLLAVKANELENYFDMEKEKFKQASDQIKKMQLTFNEKEGLYENQLTRLQEEISSLKQLQNEYQKTRQDDEAIIEEYRTIIDNLENDLRRANDEITSKSSEINKMSEIVQNQETQRENHEKQIETTSKVNRQMKAKLKEFIKEKSKTDPLLAEKQASLDEAQNIISELRASVAELEKAQETVKQRDARILELEEEGNLKSADVKKLRQTIYTLEESLKNVEENMKNEVFEATERQVTVEQTVKDQEEILSRLKDEINEKDVEINDLRSMIASQKEEFLTIQQEIQAGKEEAMEMQNVLRNRDDTIFQLETANASLQNEILEANNKLSEAVVEVNNKKSEISNSAEIIMNLQHQISSMNDELSRLGDNLHAAQEDVRSREEENASKSNQIEHLQTEIERATEKIFVSESEFKAAVDGLSHDLLMKTNEIASQVKGKEILSQKITDLEKLLAERDTRLEDVADSESKVVNELRVENLQKNDALLKAHEELSEIGRKVVEVEEALRRKECELEEAKSNAAEIVQMHASALAEKDARVTELVLNCSEKSALLETSLQKMADLENSVNENKQSREHLLQNAGELESKIVSLENENEKQINVNEKLKHEVEGYLEEVKNLKFMLQAESERAESDTENFTIQNEKYKSLVEDFEHASQEKDILLQQNADLAEETRHLSEKISDTESQLEDLRNTNESLLHSKNVADVTIADLKQRLDENATNNETYLSRIDELQQTSDARSTMLEQLSSKNEELVSDLKIKDKEISELAREIDSMKEESESEVSKQEQIVSMLENDVRELQVEKGESQQAIDALTIDVLEKSSKIKELLDILDKSEELKEAHEKQHVSFEELKLELSGKEEICCQLQSKIESLKNEYDKCQIEFDAEREELKTNVKQLEIEQKRSLTMFEKLNEEGQMKDEKIEQFTRDLDLTTEENTTLKQAIEEKTKALEEFKAKAIKKMKSLKEESKKFKADFDDGKVKQERIFELERQLESTENDRSLIASSLDAMEEKMIEMERSSHIKEEDIKNAEEEISKIKRLMDNKNEEVLMVKDMLKTSMDELQSMQSVLIKKEEKMKMLQDQLIANEEDMTISFTEKEKIIEDLQEKLHLLEKGMAEKEVECSNLSSSLLSLKETSRVYDEELSHIPSLKNDLKIAIEERNKLESVIRDLKVEYEKGIKDSDEKNSQLLEEIASKDAEITNLKSYSVQASEYSQNEPTDLCDGPVNQGSAEMSSETALRSETKDDVMISSHVSQQISEPPLNGIVAENEELKTQLDSLREELSVMKLYDKEKLSELDLVHEQLSEKCHELETLKSRQQDDTTLAYVDQISDLQAQLDKAKKTMEDYKSRASKKLKALKEENRALTESSQDLRIELEKQGNLSNDLKGVIKNLELTIKMKNDEFETSNADLSMQLQLYEDNLKEKEDSIQCLNDELFKVKEAIKKKEDLIKNLQHELTSKEEDLYTRLEQSKTEKSLFENEYENQKQSLLSLQNELAQAYSEVSTLKDDVNTKSQKIELLTANAHEPLEAKGDNEGEDRKSDSGTVRGQEDTEMGDAALQLKLAKAVKRIGKMKKDLQMRDEKIRSLEADILFAKSVEKGAEESSEIEQRTNEAYAKTESSEVAYPPQVVAICATEAKESFLEGSVDSSLLDGPSILPEGDNPDLSQMKTLNEEGKEVITPDNDLLETHRRELAEKEERIEELARKHSKATEMLEKAKKKIAMLKKAEINVEKEKKRLKEELVQVKESKAVVDRDAQQNASRICELEQKMKCVEDDLERSLESRDKLNAKNGDLRKLIEVMAEEKHDLDSEMKDILNEIKEVMDIKNTLMNDLREANDKLAKAENDYQSLKEALDERQACLAKRIVEIDGENKALVEKCAKRDIEVDELTRNNDTLDRECGELRATVGNMQTRIDYVAQMNTELQNRLVANENSDELQELEAFVSGLKEELMKKDTEIQDKEIAMQNLEMELRSLVDAEAETRLQMEEEMESLRNSMNDSIKEFNEERLVYNSTIEELKSAADSAKETALRQEICLLQSKFDKEREMMTENLKMEKDELVRSFNEEQNSKEEMQQKIEKLTSEKDHKDTIIAKLKLKLKQTIKDRDVIKGNSQSEIERLSQEKDVVFNEFQAKMQQVECECTSLREHISSLENTNVNLREELVSKDKIVETLSGKCENAGKQIESSELSNRENQERIRELEQRIDRVEKEIEQKDEVIEKYEWEASEKDDQIRMLERNMSSLHEEIKDMDELKSTLEETITVKEQLINDIQAQLETFKKSSLEDMSLREKELADLKTEFQAKENEGNLHVEKIRELEMKLDALGQALDSHGSDDLVNIINDREKKYKDETARLDSHIEKLKADKDAFDEEIQKLETELDHLKVEKNAVNGIVVQHLDNFDVVTDDSASLDAKLDLFVAKSLAWKEQINDLNDRLDSQTESYIMLEKQFRDQESILKELKSYDHEANIAQLNETLSTLKSQCLEYEEKVNALEVELKTSARDLEDKDIAVNKIVTEKENLELKIEELETELEVNKLETEQLKINQNHSKKQIEGLMQESESLRSKELPELQSSIASKNKSMLSLREDFSEIISDKDDVITNLRCKIDEVKHEAMQQQDQLNEEVESLKSMLGQKDDFINKLTESLSSSKKNSDWLTRELGHVIKERNSIGGSIQNQFESISKGLRGDIELFLEDKKNFETEFEIEKLQLERKISELQHELGKREKSLDARNSRISELNFVIQELQRRVEFAADVLRKENYYKQLEENLQKSYNELAESSRVIESLERKQRELEGVINEFEINLKLEKAHREEMVIENEHQLRAADENLIRACQLVRDELESVIEEERKEIKSLQTTLQETSEKHELENAKVMQEMSTEIQRLTTAREAMEKTIENLQREKEALKDEIMNEVLSTADEKMLKLKLDFDKVIHEKDTKLEETTRKARDLEDKLSSLNKSNVNLSENLFFLETGNEKLQDKILRLESSIEEQDRGHKEAMKEALAVKGKDFNDLRTQFDEALADKEQILESLRNRVSHLRNEVDAEHQKSSTLKAEKERLSQDGIQKELVIERLKVNIDSLLNSVSCLDSYDAGPSHIGLSSGGERQPGDLTNSPEEGRKEDQISHVEVNISKAKRILERFLRDKEGQGKVSFQPVEFVSSQEEPRQFRDENAHAIDTTDNLPEVTSSSPSQHVQESSTESDQTSLFGMPRIVTGLEIFASETFRAKSDDQQKSAIVNPPAIHEASENIKIPENAMVGDGESIQGETINDFVKEIKKLQLKVNELEKENVNMETKVRSNFDDILQNLREDLQTSQIENNLLQAEVFMLKNLKNEKDVPKKTHNTTSVQTELVVEGESVDVSSGVNVSSQTGLDRELSGENAPVSKDVDGGRMKSLSSNERLPEVVEDTLVSKMAFEQFQTYSDSSLEGEAISDYAKLELRLTDEPSEVERSQSVASLLSELETYKSKFEQSNRLIIKLKQMSKKYKNELNELQMEKFEQIRAYEDEIETVKQEIEQRNTERHIKDQEIRSLREEVKVLVKEKSDMSNSVKARIEEITTNHKSVLQELKQKQGTDLAIKDETIRVLYNVEHELKNKITDLQKQISILGVERNDLQALLDTQDHSISEQKSMLEEYTSTIQAQEEKSANLESDLLSLQSENKMLEEQLFTEKVDSSTENPNFDDRIMEEYREQLESKNNELEEAFDLIRALEKNLIQTKKEYETHLDELNRLIETDEETIDRMTSEKIELEKSMLEMRDEVKTTIEERDGIVSHWKSEASRIVEENVQQHADVMEKNISVIEQQKAECDDLRSMIAAKNKEVDDFKARLNNTEVTMQELEQENGHNRSIAESNKIELEHALSERNLAEDKLQFFKHQIDIIQNERMSEIDGLKGEIEAIKHVAEKSRNEAVEKENTVVALYEEIRVLKQELDKNKKKLVRMKKESDSSKRLGQELGVNIRQEMENVVNEIQDEKHSLYMQLLSKENTLQEARMYADHLAKEKEQWLASIKNPESDGMLDEEDGRARSPDLDGLSLQVQQLRVEKDLAISNLENKISEVTEKFASMEKLKRNGDLEIAELKTRLQQQVDAGSQDQNKTDKIERIKGFGKEVQNIKGEFDSLKKEAANFTEDSRNMLSQLENELTGLILNSVQGDRSLAPKGVQPSVSPVTMRPIDLTSISSEERLDDNNADIDEARERVAMLEESLCTWRERCIELENEVEVYKSERTPVRAGSQEFLINIENDEGPSIESARAGLGQNIQRLMKYSTSGMKFKSSPGSILRRFFNKQRGPIAAKKILLMTYLLAIHVLAFLSVYWLLAA